MTFENLKVLSYDQELLVVNSLLEYKDIHKVAASLKIKEDIITQVMWKYKDVIALLLTHREINDMIEERYKDTLELTLTANEKAIKLLARQIDILYDEFFSEANKGVVMKDYLINQIIAISDKLQKLLDTNTLRFRENREILEKRISGFKAPDGSNNDPGNYSENNLSVAEKLARLTAQRQENQKAAMRAYTFQFDLYDKDGNFIKHYEGFREASEDGIGSESGMQKYVKKLEKDPTLLFKETYSFKNIKRGI